MKEKAIAKINTFGKVGEIIAQIGRIILIIAAVGLLAAGIVRMTMPKDSMVMEYYQGCNMKISAADIEEAEKEETVNEIISEFENGALGVTETVVNGQNMQIDVMKEFMTVNSVNYDEEADVIAVNVQSNPVDVFHPSKILLVVFAQILTFATTFITLTFVKKLCKEFKVCETPFAENVIKRMKQVAYSLIPWCVTYPLSATAAEFMTSGALKFSLDLGLILAVLVILALAHIFKYGAMLQQESDETL